MCQYFKQMYITVYCLNSVKSVCRAVVDPSCVFNFETEFPIDLAGTFYCKINGTVWLIGCLQSTDFQKMEVLNNTITLSSAAKWGENLHGLNSGAYAEVAFYHFLSLI